MPDFVDMEDGVLYVSTRYGTAIHLCACGCGQETVTPIDKTNGWALIESDSGTATLIPSIGNFQFPCRSHYWITDSRTVWC